MRVLVLGASGNVGRGVTRNLAKSDLVTELVLAGRRLDAVEAAAAKVGEKARAAQLDIQDAARLRSLSAACDIVVHAAGPHYDTLLPALRAAIDVGVHFTDYSDGGRSIRQALTLDAEAKAAGITAIVGLGLSPGMTNLLAKHACNRLDAVDELQIVWLANQSLANWRRAWGRGVIMPSLLDSASGAVPTYRDGAWVDIMAPVDGVDIVFPGGATARAYPSGFPEPVTLLRYLPGVKSVSALVAYLPERVSDLYQEQVRRISAGACTAQQASDAMYAALDAEPEPLPEASPAFPGFVWFVRARGQKNGRAVCLTCTAPGEAGNAMFALASLQILRGEISQRGVIPPEACLDPLPFLAQVVEMLPEGSRPAAGQLIVESWE